jgi:hypothetical protein
MSTKAQVVEALLANRLTVDGCGAREPRRQAGHLSWICTREPEHDGLHIARRHDNMVSYIIWNGADVIDDTRRIW